MDTDRLHRDGLPGRLALAADNSQAKGWSGGDFWVVANLLRCHRSLPIPDILRMATRPRIHDEQRAGAAVSGNAVGSDLEG